MSTESTTEATGHEDGAGQNHAGAGRPPVPPRRLPPGGARGHGPMASMGMPAEKSMTFGPSARRLIGRMGPEGVRVALVLLLAVVSVSLSVVGP